MTTFSSGVRRPAPADLERLPVGDGWRVHGHVEPGYGRVLDEFVRNFAERGEIGAGCAVVVDGRFVVDLWGGLADARSGRPWERDTAAVIFSCTKGVLALCAYLLVQEGRLDLDEPVATYWPEFGQAGKHATTLRHAMSHRAGVASLDVDLPRADVLAWDPVVAAIAAQAPNEPVDAGFVYHGLTYGWIVGEVIRRVTGQLPGAHFRETVGDPLDLHTWIGLPDAARATVAFMQPPLPDEDSDEAREAARVQAEVPAVARALTLGTAFAFPADDDGYVTFNDPDIQAAEIPGANGISSAASLAIMYATAVGAGGRPALLTDASVDDLLVVRSAGRQLTGVPDDGARWGTGFQLASPPSQPMLGGRSFGHAGAGGQLAFADPDAGAGFAYLSSQMGGYGDARASSVSQALRHVLDR